MLICTLILAFIGISFGIHIFCFSILHSLRMAPYFNAQYSYNACTLYTRLSEFIQFVTIAYVCSRRKEKLVIIGIRIETFAKNNKT